jgi:autotransporter-associated beta strand protein
LTNWSTDPDNTTPNPGAIPGGSDDLFFNISTGNGNTIIDLGTSNRNAESLRINNTGTTGFRANASASATARTLSINPRGITMAPGAGVVTFGVDSATNGRVDLSLNALTNSITNNSSSNLNINNRVQSNAVGGATIINNGTGTGYVGMGDLRGTVAKIVQNSATSVLGLRQNSSTFAGTVDILKGTVLIGTHANNLGTNAGQVNLGSSAELASDAATLEINDSASITYTAKPIVLGTTSGLLKIVLRDDGGTRTHTITGAISGANNLTLENQANGLNADDNLVFSTGGLNNAGTITHIGDSAGSLIINSVIGPLVTGVTQNSATSPLVLTGSNTYPGTTTVSAGGLLVNGAHSGVGLATVASGARIGGTGSLAGGLTIASGGLFVFNPADSTLDVSGAVSLDNSFSVASLVNLDGSAINWASVTDSSYSLIGLTSSTFNSIANFGPGAAADIGTGRTAYFTNASESGGLNLIVVPEPSAGLAIATVLTAAACWWRARSAAVGRDA